MAESDQMKQSREELQTILSQREYQQYSEDNQNVLEVWWGRFTDWLGEQLAELFPAMQPSTGFADGILIMMIIAVLVLIGWFLFRRARISNKTRQFHDFQPLQSHEKRNWSYQDHLSEARRHESNDNFTHATRHMFLALLLYFHEKEWLKARTWKTNWDYYAELQQLNQQRANSFYQLALIFDESVYGERQMSEKNYSQYRDETMNWFGEHTGEASGDD